jgi:hypothetical protein
MSRALRILFGFRPDLGLDQRWWHRLAKVVYVLGLVAFGFWGAGLPVSDYFPADDDNVDNIRIVESIADFTKARPEDGDPVDSFFRKYRNTSGKREADGTVTLVFYEGSMYCAVSPYDHLHTLSQYMRPKQDRQNTEADALALLRNLNVAERDPAGYSCISFDPKLPPPTEIFGWEYTLRAKMIGNAEKYALLGLAWGILSLVVLNLYYRGFVYIVCGPRRTH